MNGKAAAAWLAGMTAVAVPAAIAFSSLCANARSDPLHWLMPASIQTVALALIAAVKREDDDVIYGLLAGACGGAIVALAGALAVPHGWKSSDIAWHIAKTAAAAEGSPLDDPIVRTPTIYPFLFHAVLSRFAGEGAEIVHAMTRAIPLFVASAIGAFWWAARGFLPARRAAFVSVAFAGTFYVPTAGLIFLPTPFNASLVLVLAGLGLIARAGRGGDSRGLLVLGGLALGTAVLLWYAHAIWILAVVSMRAATSPRSAASIVAGGSVPAAALCMHVGYLATHDLFDLSVVVGGSDGAVTFDRMRAMAVNALTLSGDVSLEGVGTRVGAVMALAVVAALVVGKQRSPSSTTWYGSVAAAFAIAFVVVTLSLEYWEPFSWRFAFLTYAWALIGIARSSPLKIDGRSFGLEALGAVLAIWWASSCLTPKVYASYEALRVHEEFESEIARFVSQATEPGEPVFATVPTWEKSIASAVPRPSMTDRKAGRFKYVPAAVADARFAAYSRALAAPDGRTALNALEPYGFRYAVVSRADRSHTGIRMLEESCRTEINTGMYRVLDLDSCKR